MITFADSVRGTKTVPASHSKFLAMMPQIRQQARVAFRGARPEAKEELVAEVVANAFCAYARLVERGKADLAYPSPLAQYAIRQIRTGRRVGCKLNVRNVRSQYAQRSRGIILERLDQFHEEEGQWREVLIEDRQAGPAETAAARIDVADWFESLGRGKRKIAKTLARGEDTSTVARMFGLSASRISQLRQELKRSWASFHGQVVVG